MIPQILDSRFAMLDFHDFPTGARPAPGCSGFDSTVAPGVIRSCRWHADPLRAGPSPAEAPEDNLSAMGFGPRRRDVARSALVSGARRPQLFHPDS